MWELIDLWQSVSVSLKKKRFGSKENMLFNRVLGNRHPVGF